jgi:predicted acylesterase/phospholipase RssA
MSTLDKNWKNLVLAGGGYKGKLYRGVFQALQQKGVVAKIRNVSGSSIGAVYGMFLCIGMGITEIKKIESQITISNLAGDTARSNFCIPDSFEALKKNVYAIFMLCKEIWSLVNSAGIHDIKPGTLLLKKIIRDNIGNSEITFRQLKRLSEKAPARFKNLYVTGTLINLEKLSYETHYFSHQTTPSMKIADAVAISVRFPIMFTPKVLRKGGRIYYWVDGGLSRNIPLCSFAFDPKETLVVCFKRARNFWDNLPSLFGLRYLYTLFRIYDQIESTTIEHLHKYTIQIDPENLRTFFDVPEGEREQIIDDAKNRTLWFLDYFSDPDYSQALVPFGEPC